MTVAIYARYSSDKQSEASIEDQVRRCREHIERSGGDPDRALVFSDYGISGASLQRPGQIAERYRARSALAAAWPGCPASRSAATKSGSRFRWS